MTEQIKTIKIYQDWKMLISDWILFTIGLLVVASFFLSMITLINNLQEESSKILGFIVLLFALTKIIFFVRLPPRYSSEEIITNLK